MSSSESSEGLINCSRGEFAELGRAFPTYGQVNRRFRLKDGFGRDFLAGGWCEWPLTQCLSDVNWENLKEDPWRDFFPLRNLTTRFWLPAGPPGLLIVKDCNWIGCAKPSLDVPPLLKHESENFMNLEAPFNWLLFPSYLK